MRSAIAEQQPRALGGRRRGPAAGTRPRGRLDGALDVPRVAVGNASPGGRPGGRLDVVEPAAGGRLDGLAGIQWSTAAMGQSLPVPRGRACSVAAARGRRRRARWRATTVPAMASPGSVATHQHRASPRALRRPGCPTRRAEAEHRAPGRTGTTRAGSCRPRAARPRRGPGRAPPAGVAQREPQRRGAGGAGGLDEITPAQRQDLAADEAGRRHPGRRAEHHDRRGERGAVERDDQQREEQAGHGEREVGGAHQQSVDPRRAQARGEADAVPRTSAIGAATAPPSSDTRAPVTSRLTGRARRHRSRAGTAAACASRAPARQA